jgi:hypothetical protein
MVSSMVLLFRDLWVTLMQMSEACKVCWTIVEPTSLKVQVKRISQYNMKKEI